MFENKSATQFMLTTRFTGVTDQNDQKVLNELRGAITEYALGYHITPREMLQFFDTHPSSNPIDVEGVTDRKEIGNRIRQRLGDITGIIHPLEVEQSQSASTGFRPMARSVVMPDNADEMRLSENRASISSRVEPYPRRILTGEAEKVPYDKASSGIAQASPRQVMLPDSATSQAIRAASEITPMQRQVILPKSQGAELPTGNTTSTSWVASYTGETGREVGDVRSSAEGGASYEIKGNATAQLAAQRAETDHGRGRG